MPFNKNMKHLLSLLLLLPLLAFGQNLNKSTLAVSNFCDTIPFEYVKGKMLVKVKINNQPRTFIFDTGAPLLISEELQKQMDNTIIGSGALKDITGKTIEQQIVKLDRLNIGDLAFLEANAVVYKKDKTGLLNCFDADGIIGSTLLKHCVVHIDTEQQHIVLTDKIERIPLTGAHRMKIKLDANSRPLLTFPIGKRAKIETLFDSGSDKFMPLSYKTFTYLSKKSAVRLLNEGYGSISSGLYGAGQAGKEYRVTVDTIQIGGVSIDGVVTTVSEHKNKNALGMGLAQYGTITIDYLRKHFYFQPKATSQSFQQANFHGFGAQVIDDSYVVSVVYEGTLAAKTGIKKGIVYYK